ncbi:MAG: shikimate kinase [Kiritimatiellae bacterium]|nr:shikimate kinase [Kiritimatiellia bacterium]
MNIVLIGFMGTGKTSSGKKVAELLGMTFIDMDHLIEERENRKISDIFETDGEPFFRQLEFDLAKELSNQDNLVIATGGGIVLNQENINNFKSSGIVICLSADPQIILERVAKETHRPLLEGDEKMNKILGILESRKELYGAIKNQVDTTKLDIDGVVAGIIKIAQNH